MWNAPPACPEIPENPEVSLSSNVLKDKTYQNTENPVIVLKMGETLNNIK